VDTVVDYTPTQGDVVSDNCENVNLIHWTSFLLYITSLITMNK
jgi:hypothetical protein